MLSSSGLIFLRSTCNSCLQKSWSMRSSENLGDSMYYLSLYFWRISFPTYDTEYLSALQKGQLPVVEISMRPPPTKFLLSGDSYCTYRHTLCSPRSYDCYSTSDHNHRPLFRILRGTLQGSGYTYPTETRFWSLRRKAAGLKVSISP